MLKDARFRADPLAVLGHLRAAAGACGCGPRAVGRRGVGRGGDPYCPPAVLYLCELRCSSALPTTRLAEQLVAEPSHLYDSGG